MSLRKNIVVRSDGNSQSGLGHLYRSFALIEMYSAVYNCLLVVREDSAPYIPAQYAFITLPAQLAANEEAAWLAERFEPSAHWIIADGYHFGSDWQKRIKHSGYKLLYVDDTISEHMYADVVVNHAMGITAQRYQKESYTRFALGPQYAILRPPFLKAASEKRHISELTSAFVCFGGSDPLDLTVNVVRALLHLVFAGDIVVVLGSAYQGDLIYHIAAEHPRVRVSKNLNAAELSSLMKQCSFAISSSSTILYELCAVKMPVICGHYVENQKNIYQASVEAGIAFPAGDLSVLTQNQLTDVIRGFMARGQWMSYVDAQAKLFDSHIAGRFLELLTEISYRKAQLSDTLLIFDWANDPVSRANSYFSANIPLETHQNWFEKKLEDSNCFIYIAEQEQVPIGMVRYEKGNDYTTIGILVSQNHRGRGFATTMLRDTARLYFSTESLPVHAFIKTSNLASISSFKKAGFELFKEEVVHGAPSVVYRLEKTHVQS